MLLCILLISIIALRFFYKPAPQIYITAAEQLEIATLQTQVDSLKSLAQEESKPKIYPFNPNFITDYRGYTLGMSTIEIDRLHRFRESDKWINSVADFKKVTKVSDSLLAAISPYFKFPDWVANPKPNKTSTPKKKWKTYEEKGKLNSITLGDLMAIEHMDEEAAHKIIAHHKKVKGYLVDQQIYDVYGVETKIKRAVLNEYTVKEKPSVILLDVNTTNASDLSTVPLLNYELAKEIVDYRILREGIQSIDELKNLEGMTDYKFERIKLYLKVN